MTTPFIVLFRVQYSELHTGRFLAYPVLLHPSRPIGPLYSVPLQFPRLVLLRCRCKLRKERKMITQSAKTRYPLNFLHQHTIPPTICISFLVPRLLFALSRGVVYFRSACPIQPESRMQGACNWRGISIVNPIREFSCSISV